MQSVQTLIDHLKQQDIKLYIEGDRLRCNAPKDKLTSSLKASLAERRDEIVDFLRQQVIFPTIVPQPELRHHPFPLTDIQQAYWLGRQEGLELGGVSAHIYWEIETKGIEVGALERAWRRLIERHEMLRAIIDQNGQQRILETVPSYHIPVIDLHGEAVGTQTTRLQEIRDRLSHQVLPCDRWPLFELQAVRLDRQTIRFCFSYDLLIGDAWSVQILMGELSQLLRQPTLNLPSLELSFRDCVLAERDARKDDRYQRDRDYWQTRLTTLPPPPKLPLQANPTALLRSHFVRRRRKFSADVWKRLKRKASQAKLTPSGVLLAAFAEILATWSKNPHFTLNLTLVNRPPLHPEIGRLVGDFTSITLLEANCMGEDSFVVRAQRLQKQLWDDLAHRAYSGVQILRELARLSSRHSATLMPVVFTSMLALAQQKSEEWKQKSVLFQGLGELVYMISQTPQVYLDSQISEQAGSLVVSWDAVEELFPEGLLDAMFVAYGDFLQRLANEDEVWTAKARQFLPLSLRDRLAAINDTDTEGGESSALLQTLFFEQAIAHPERTAVIAEDRVLTYGELRDLAVSLAHQLRQKGARPNQLIAIVMEKGWEQVVATLAIMTAGAAYVPIDPELPAERRFHLFSETKVRWVLTQSKFEESLNWPDDLERLWVNRLDSPESRPVLEPQQTAADLAYVIYTSGSTGLPKGVAIEHRGAVNTILDINQRFQVGESDRLLALSSLSFDLSVYDIFGTLAAGGTLIVIAPQATKDPAHWVELIERHRITLWNSVPALMQMLLDYTAVHPDFNLSSLRLVLLSGDWIPLTLPGRIQAAMAGGLVISLGGATEASIWSIFYGIETIDPDWKSIPYGHPLANQRFYVLDEALEPRPFWVPGQLYIGGIGLAREYWRNEEKTARSFILHPKTGERLYKTGDLGRHLPDGAIEFLGREDFQVKVNGYRIELGEIESVLRQHPSVKETVILALGDSQENKHLVAYVVLCTEPDLRLQNEETADTKQVERVWKAAVEAGAGRAQEAAWRLDHETFEILWKQQDRRYILSVCLAFDKLGIYQSGGEAYGIDEIASRCRIVPRYRKWLSRALKALVNEGLLSQEGDRFRSISPLLERARRIFQETLPDIPATQTWLELLPDEPDESLADLLVEKIHSAELYASNTTLTIYEAIFADCNEIAAGIIEAFIAASDPSRPIRILEIGGGYGTITAHLLPLFPRDLQSTARTTYYFTDISHFFLQKARDRFSEYSFVRYGLLDIEKLPQQQGYDLHGFDLVIAAAVLHNTHNLRETLGHVRSLLAPNGLLLALEKNQFHRWFDLNMGLQKGFERFDDFELRSEHPVLSKKQWQTLLTQQGFTESNFFNPPDSIRDRIGFDVFLARGPSSVDSFNPKSLHNYMSQKLPRYMLPSSYIYLDVMPLNINGKLDRKQLPIPQKNCQVIQDYVEPRTKTEKVLAQIWSEVLQVEKIGIHDNFFEIGGDSLLNIQIVTRSHQNNLDLKPQHIFQFPTIAELAASFKKSFGENKYLSLSPLIAIKPSGSKKPLFCIHSSSGSANSFVEMSQHFDRERPLYGLQSQGFDGELQPLSTIEEMAASYIKAIQTIQPIGPYYLCGWSMGGIVAYEMAKQLEKNNQKIEFIGLIDIMADQRDRQLELLSITHPTADLNVQVVSPEQQKIIANLSQINVQAMLRYELKHYAGKVTLFKTQEQPEEISNSAKFGWDKYVLGELVVCEMPGNHFSIMTLPNVQILAEEITNSLDNLCARKL